MMKVTLDHEGCIGCGLCVSTCPAEYDGARPSAEYCPVSVIEAEE